MSVNSTYPNNQYTGVVIAEGYAPSGEATINLSAGTYVFETIPATYLRSPENFTGGTSKANEWVAVTGIPSVLFLGRTDSAIELLARTAADLNTLNPIANSAFQSTIIWDGTNFIGQPTGITNNDGAAVLAYSTNGLNWQYKNIGGTRSGATALAGLKTFAYDANVTNKYVFSVATNSTTGALWTSTDFTTWTSRNLPVAPSSTSGAAGIVINPNATNKYIISLGGSASNQFCYSTDAVTWTNVTFTYANTVNALGATNNTASTNEIYVYPGANSTNNAVTSTDGVTWTSRATGVTAAAHEVVWFNSNYYIFYGNSNSYAYSTDGVTWTTATFPTAVTTPSSTGRWSVILDGKLYRPTNVAGYWGITTNGTTWTFKRYSTAEIQLFANDTELYQMRTASAVFGKLIQPLYYKVYATDDSTQIP